MGTIYCPKSLRACAIRVTRLGWDGTPFAPTEPQSRIQSAAFARLQLSPDILSGSETVIRSPGGNVAVIDVDPDVLKGFDLTLQLCGMPLEFMVMMAVETLWTTGVDPDLVGGVLRNELTEPCALPFMVELWSKNVADNTCGVTGTDTRPYVHWVLPMTGRWQINGNLAYESAPLEIELKGYATANDRWFPSFPGSTFPSYVVGQPTGSPPTILPSGIAADPWTLDDLAKIRAGGPLGWRCVGSLPEPLTECAFVEAA